MALPNLSTTVYCVDFQSGSADWYSPVGSFESVGAPYACGRSWVVVNSGDWQLLLDAAQGPQLDFYADSTALFYLGMTAVVTLWALKAFVLKLIYAS